MSNIVSFVKSGVETPTPVERVTVESVNTYVPTNTALVPLNALPVSRPLALQDDADIDFSEINIPRINIVQKVGDLSNNFTPGNIVLNQSICIHSPRATTKSSLGEVIAADKPLELTVVGFRPSQFTEKVAGGKLGILCNTKEEVVAINGTLDYKTWKSSIASGNPKKYFQT